MKRIFIAVKINPEEPLLKMISRLKSGLKDESIKWTDPANIHITLVFLGDTEEEKVRSVALMIKEKCAATGKFELALKGGGVFRNIDDPRVIYAGIESSEKLNQLNIILKGGLKELNIKTEDRPFRPHLTIGRIRRLKPQNSLGELLSNYKETFLQSVPVDEIILYESILSKEGPVYIPIAKIEL